MVSAFWHAQEKAKNRKRHTQNSETLPKTALPKLWNFLATNEKQQKNSEKLQKPASNFLRVPLEGAQTVKCKP